MNDLQKRLEALEQENCTLQETFSKSQLKNDEVRKHLRSSSAVGLSTNNGGGGRLSVTELSEMVDELTTKLQNITYQKNKLELQSVSLLSENAKLLEIVSKQEMEIGDLQIQLRYLEEVVSGGVVSQPTTPRLPTSPRGTPSHLGSELYPTIGDATLGGDCSSRGPPPTGPVTLFSELQTEFGTLQSNFDNVTRNCTCLANSTYKPKEIVSSIDTPTDTPTAYPKVNWSNSRMKGLFDEVYATLKQTTVVADQLLEKRNEKKTVTTT